MRELERTYWRRSLVPLTIGNGRRFPCGGGRSLTALDALRWPAMDREPPDEPALRHFLRHHRVYFSVDREWSFGRGGGRLPGRYEIRLFAAHDKGARALPACAKTKALASSLRSFAEAIAPSCPAETRIEVGPFRPALYESREVPGVDEVAISISISRARPDDAAAAAAEARCMRSLRERLKRFALRER